MENSEQRVWLTLGLTLFLIVGSFFVGKEYQQRKDALAIALLASTQNTFDGMKRLEVPQDEFFLKILRKEGGYSTRLNIQDDDDGIGYVEIHYLPRAAFPKIHK